MHGAKKQFEGDVKEEEPEIQSFLEAEQRKADCFSITYVELWVQVNFVDFNISCFSGLNRKR